MSTIFVSSTYIDLKEHRQAVNEVLSRMKKRYSAMEFFGSRADKAVPACLHEIDNCDIFIGIYAWRYGWCPNGDSPSVTEIEFNYARENGKKCLCYVVSEEHPWPPLMIDQGNSAQYLRKFKRRVSELVRSEFNTPDNLAMQVAADLVRELTPENPKDSFGSLLQLNWSVFSGELQRVLQKAYVQARAESADGVVATRHVIASLADIPSSGHFIVNAFPDVNVPRLLPDLPEPSIDEMFSYERPVSGCILASMNRLLPKHSPTQRLLAVEIAVDLLKYGRGSSVADYRRAGVDAMAVEKTMELIDRTAKNTQLIKKALNELTEEQLLHLAYVSNIHIPMNMFGRDLRKSIIYNADRQGTRVSFVGELIRRHPEMVKVK